MIKAIEDVLIVIVFLYQGIRNIQNIKDGVTKERFRCKECRKHFLIRLIQYFIMRSYHLKNSDVCKRGNE